MRAGGRGDGGGVPLRLRTLGWDTHHSAPPNTRLTGANAPTGILRLPLLTGRGLPMGRPRRSTGWACLAIVPSGSRTVTVPDLPACSHSRRTVPAPSGFAP